MYFRKYFFRIKEISKIIYFDLISADIQMKMRAFSIFSGISAIGQDISFLIFALGGHFLKMHAPHDQISILLVFKARVNRIASLRKIPRLDNFAIIRGVYGRSFGYDIIRAEMTRGIKSLFAEPISPLDLAPIFQRIYHIFQKLSLGEALNGSYFTPKVQL